MPTVREFHEVFLEASRIKNKPSSVKSQEMILRVHILPHLGDLTVSAVTYAVIEDFKVALSKTRIHNVEKRYGAKLRAARGKVVDEKPSRLLTGRIVSDARVAPSGELALHRLLRL